MINKRFPFRTVLARYPFRLLDDQGYVCIFSHGHDVIARLVHMNGQVERKHFKSINAACNWAGVPE